MKKNFELTESKFSNLLDIIHKFEKKNIGTFKVEVLDTKMEVFPPQSSFYRKKILFSVEWTWKNKFNWEILAVKKLQENGVTVFSLTNEPLPKDFWDNDFTCDHCHVNRYRTNIYIIQNLTTKEIKKVGSGCLNDFCGIDMDTQIYLFNLLENVIDEKESEFQDLDDMSFKNPFAYINVDRFMAMAYKVETEDKRSYVSQDSSKEKGIISTRAKTLDYYLTYDKELESKYTDFALKAKEYYLSLPANSEFMLNLQTFLNSKTIKQQYLGFIAFVPFGYLKHLEKEAMRKDKFSFKNDFFGTEKAKFEMSVVLRSLFSFESNFYGRDNMQCFYIFSDNCGRKIVWKTSIHDLKIGGKYTLKGSVKEHKIYKEEKETIVTRCKILPLSE